MTVCRSLAAIDAAADADAQGDPPLTTDQAAYVAALTRAHQASAGAA